MTAEEQFSRLEDLCCAELLCLKLERQIRQREAEAGGHREKAILSGPLSYLRHAGRLEDLGALLGFMVLSAGAELVCAGLRLRFARSFFRIAGAAFLVSALLLLLYKLLKGRGAFRAYQSREAALLRSCEQELDRLRRRLGEGKELCSGLWEGLGFPETWRSVYGAYRLWDACGDPDRLTESLRDGPPDRIPLPNADQLLRTRLQKARAGAQDRVSAWLLSAAEL